MVMVAGIRFKRASKVYDFDSNGLDLNPGDMVIVEVEKGMGMGHVVNSPREVDPSKLTRKLKKVIRVADPVDLERHSFNLEREEEAYRICKEKIAGYGLPMKLVRVEYLFDSSKAIFYFTSESRVDFRELVKDLASEFHTRIEMRQVGVRDEAKMLGGIGPCGRELCCAGFLSDFEPVTIKMAKEQNLALNPSKISGICGRLMCCLAYEHGMYQGGEGLEKSNGAKECGGCGKHGTAVEAMTDEAAVDEGLPPSPEAVEAAEPGVEERKETSLESARPHSSRQGRDKGRGAEGESSGEDREGRKKRRGRRRRRRKTGTEARGGEGAKGGERGGQRGRDDQGGQRG